jgi:excisionase family DNA binding protein
MLNTAEAAQFLRVSQASIRRWTDAGLLGAHRVGPRRERRFEQSDLLAFMDHQGSRGAGTAVSVGGVCLPAPAHLATFYSSTVGGLRLTVPFLAEGLRLGQPCYLVAADEVLERYTGALTKEDVRGLNVVRFGAGSVAAALAQWEGNFASALAKGPALIRVVGEMTSERTMFSSEEEMLRYEEAFDLMSRRYPVAVMCQYDVREFSGIAMLRALKAHPDLFELRMGTFLN